GERAGRRLAAGRGRVLAHLDGQRLLGQLGTAAEYPDEQPVPAGLHRGGQDECADLRVTFLGKLEGNSGICARAEAVGIDDEKQRRALWRDRIGLECAGTRTPLDRHLGRDDEVGTALDRRGMATTQEPADPARRRGRACRRRPGLWQGPWRGVVSTSYHHRW